MPAAMQTVRGSIPGRQDVAYVTETNGYAFGIAINRWSTHMRDLSKLFNGEIRDNIENAMKKAFQKGGNQATGGKWTQLSEKYAMWKTVKYDGPKGKYYAQILSLSGRMQRSLTDGGDGSIWQGRPHGFTYGTSVTSSKGFGYPTAHVTGTKHMPRRNFLGWNPRGQEGRVWRAAIAVPIARELGIRARRDMGEFVAVDMAGLARAAIKDGTIQGRGPR